MVEYVSLKLFYPMLFLTIIAIAIIIGLVITKLKDTNLFNNIFNKHTDEHIDTTTKMKEMHDNVIPITYTTKHEKETHSIEVRLKKVENDVADINKKIDFILEQAVFKENN